ncbi:vacuolar sorting protein-like protein [Eremomyces bilateralis CBS 781.70]|uniref:Vacuolar sorting protein-like protein n=1 Tax=Eremomyces bilateralis CBS 781.70 TaxID=1392243 RepID=A0A6G1FR15_9PEZI|nr:vacuolar sorting protein-like protein [Eremomyces bilateralis CBS 781.70]KAF1808129.1 vacuolar sorting protein-like protein [Eremomyces bilateralis CBS 781.70]
MARTVLEASEIGEKARRDLLLLLEGVRGKKNLVIEKGLAGTLGLFVKFSTLQEYGVDKVFFLENDNVDSSQKNIVFLARSDNLNEVHAIASQIKRLRQSGQTEHEISIFWVPRRTLVSDQILEEEGALGDVNVSEYPLYFVPVAEDILSLELENSFRDLYLRKDPTCIFTAAKALMLLQQHHGLFPRITGKGNNAKRLADLLMRMRSELTASSDFRPSGAGYELTPSNTIESLIIIDREVDFPSALLTQLTYEGLVDECFGIESNQIEVDSSVVGTASNTTSQGSSSGPGSASQPLRKKIILDGTESLFKSIRDTNFAVVPQVLNSVARRLQNTYENRPTASKTTAELREFVSKLPSYQSEQTSLKLHTNIAEEIQKFTQSEIFTRILEVQQTVAEELDPTSQHDTIDELISRAISLPTVLRLLCLESTMCNGLRPRDLDAFKRAILHAYGPQHLLTLSRLEKMGLLSTRSGSAFTPAPLSKSGSGTNYSYVRKALHLYMREVNEAKPDDIAYVYSGPVPLSVRLVQCVLQKQYLASLSNKHPGATNAAASGATALSQGWRPFEEAVKQIKGATFDEVQRGEEKAVRAKQILNGSGSTEGKTVLVFYLGGISRAEVAALRFVGKRLVDEGRRRNLVICTTGMVSGNDMMKAAIAERDFGGR